MTVEIFQKSFKGKELFQWILIAACWLIFIGFVSSRALASIGMISLLVASVFRHGLPATFAAYFRRKDFLALSLFFLIVFISGLWSDDKHSWLNWVRIKLPYLALPLAFAPVKRLGKENFLWVVYGFVGVMFVSSVAVLVNYFLHYQEITESIYKGSAIRMPFSHIRYTLMIVFAFFCSWFLAEKKLVLATNKESILQSALLVYFFIALHILSVRSALLGLYAGIFCMWIRLVFIKRKYLWGFVFLITGVLVPFFAVKLVPSLHHKLAYMRYDIGRYRHGETNNLSDGGRIISIFAGLYVVDRNMWLGAGAGDLGTELDRFYRIKHPEIDEKNRKPIHSQIVWTWASTGAIGLSLFFAAFLFPLFYHKHYRFGLLVILHVVLFSSFFTEATLEEQIGTGFYLITLLVLLNYLQKE